MNISARRHRSAIVDRVWNSPTLATWASFFCRAAGLAIILPLVLRHFSAAEFNVWSLFGIFAGLQLLFDMGFSVTLVRAIAVALAGASSSRSFLQDGEPTIGAPPNWAMVRRIIGTMRFVYRQLALVYGILLASGGSALLLQPVHQTEDPISAWLAWLCVVGTSYVSLRLNYLAVLLLGLNEVAVVRRWDALISVGASLSSIAILLADGTLLALVSVSQIWALVGIWRNARLCRSVHDGSFREMPRPFCDREMLSHLWPATWRSGVGVAMSYGLVQATGIVHAQFASTAATASYLLCLKVLQLVSGFSQAPFYSKLPLLPRLRAAGNTRELLNVAAAGMRWSLWAYALAFSAVSLVGPPLLTWIGSTVAFPDTLFWVLLGTMFFVERYAAMHLNLYNTTNDIITHIANGVTGVLCIGLILLLIPSLGLLAVPAGLLGGYLSFYGWYPVVSSYRRFRMRFLAFELRTSLGPLVCFAATVGWLLSRG